MRDAVDWSVTAPAVSSAATAAAAIAERASLSRGMPDPLLGQAGPNGLHENNTYFRVVVLLGLVATVLLFCVAPKDEGPAVRALRLRIDAARYGVAASAA